MTLFDSSVGWGTLALLFVCLAIALSFEFVNGFHDTAIAVATVIYTKSMKPPKNRSVRQEKEGDRLEQCNVPVTLNC
jgi:hypothetical protein